MENETVKEAQHDESLAAVVARMEKANEEHKALIEREEKLVELKLMGGGSAAGNTVVEEKKEEIGPAEYAQKALKGQI